MNCIVSLSQFDFILNKTTNSFIVKENNEFHESTLQFYDADGNVCTFGNENNRFEYNFLLF